MEGKYSLPKGITRRSDGRYQGTYYYEGKRKYLYDMDLNTLIRKMRDVQYEIDHNIFTNPDRIKLDRWFEAWMKDYKSYTLKKDTIENYKKNYRLYIQPFLGHLYVKDIRPEHIQRLFLSLKKQGYSITTLNVSRGILSGMFTQLVKNNILIKNPVALIDMPKQSERPDKRVLTLEEQKIFLQAITGSDYELLYRVAISTGLRIGEITALKWEDINFEAQILEVKGNLKYFKDTGFYIDSPKSFSSYRIVPLLPSIITLLQEHKIKQEQLKKRMGKLWRPLKGLKGLVFTDPNAPGEPVRKRTVAHDLDMIVEAINKKEKETAEIQKEKPVYMERITPHVLRHTFATRALENDIPPKIVQEILGHSSITITLDVYTHVLPSKRNKEILKMQEVFY